MSGEASWPPELAAARPPRRADPCGRDDASGLSPRDDEGSLPQVGAAQVGAAQAGAAQAGAAQAGAAQAGSAQAGAAQAGSAQAGSAQAGAAQAGSAQAGSAQAGAAAPVERGGLRARKRRQLRQQLSDTATAMFLQHGFEAVRVSDVAAACEVSEKTVFNHFASKEALVMDRLEGVSGVLRSALSAPGQSAVDAVLGVLDEELDRLAAQLTGSNTVAAAQAASEDPWGSARPPHDDGRREGRGQPSSTRDDVAARLMRYRRFGDLIRSTPSLQNHQARMVERFVDDVAQALGERARLPGRQVGVEVESQVEEEWQAEARTAATAAGPADAGVKPDHDPAVHLGAVVLVELWRVQFDSLRHHLQHLEDRDDRPSGRVHLTEVLRRVHQDVTRAALVARSALETLETGAPLDPLFPGQVSTRGRSAPPAGLEQSPWRVGET